MSTHTLTLENKPVNDIMDLAWMRFIIVVFFICFICLLSALVCKAYASSISFGSSTSSTSFTTSAFSDPKESLLIKVATVGSTIPIVQQKANTAQQNDAVKVSAQLSQLERNLYHVRSAKLTPGSITPHPIDIKNPMQPLVIVGCDPQSLKWLKRYGTKLKAIHAMGVVVNCDGQYNFKQLQNSSSIKLMPVRGDAFYQRFKAFDLQHYPVLITKNYLTQ